MAVATSYGLEFLRDLDPAFLTGAADAASLAGGAVAVVGSHTTHTDLSIFDPAGSLAFGTETAFVGTGGAVTQLDNGNIVTITSDGADLYYSIRTGGGAVVAPSTAFGSGPAIDPDVTALSGGRFAFAYSVAWTPGNRDISVQIRGGDSVVFIPVANSAENELRPSIATLNDGGFAVAWQREGTGGNWSIWYAVYNSDGTVRKAPAQFDPVGIANPGLSVVALANGGFAIAHEDNTWGGGDIDIGFFRFSATGVLQGYGDVSGNATDDTAPSLTLLSNGLVLMGTTSAGGANPSNVLWTLIDPISGDVLTTSTLGSGAGNQLDTTVAGMSLGQVASFFTNQATGDVVGHVQQAVRISQGNSENDTITGDELVDRASGGTGADTIFGLGNNDSLRGGEGNDTIDGGDGNDTVWGGPNNDSLIAGAGFDDLYGENGNDTLVGSTSRLYGGPGNDVYYVSNALALIVEAPGEGNDTAYFTNTDAYLVGNSVETAVLLGSGHNSIYGNDEANRFTGNAGNNTLIGGIGNDTLDGAGGNDSLEGADGLDTLDGAGGNDTLRGGPGDDSLSAGAGTDQLFGDDGNDTLVSLSEGITTMTGGIGDDSYYVQGQDTIVETANGGSDTVFIAGDINLANYPVENGVALGPYAHQLSGSGMDNRLTGNSGNDTIGGLQGFDTLVGGAGDDLYVDLDVFDPFTPDTIIELDGGGAHDAVVTNRGDYVLPAGVEDLFGNAGQNDLVGNSGNNTITGNVGPDALSGLAGKDTLIGGGGDDQIDGGQGADRMEGGAGDDFFYVDSRGDVVVEAAGGGDDVIFATCTYTLPSDVEHLGLVGASANLNGYGNELANQIGGTDGNNTLNGYGGNDTLYGGGGDDKLYGHTGADLMLGERGNDQYTVDDPGDLVFESQNGNITDADWGIDTVFARVDYTLPDDIENLRLQAGDPLKGTGNALNNKISGNIGANLLKGLAGADAIDGNDGADTIEGGEGNDTLSGGSQADVFRFAASNTGVDRILDFNKNADRFDLAGGTFTALTTAANGDAVLTHAGGAIRIATPPNLTLAQWNALVLPSGMKAANVAADDFTHHTFGHGLVAHLRTDIVTLAHGDWAFA